MAVESLPDHVVLCPNTHEQQKLSQHEILGACRSVSDYEKLNRVGEGTYGIVYRAKDLNSEEVVALKKIRMEREKEGLPVCSVREIGILMKLKHRWERYLDWMRFMCLAFEIKISRLDASCVWPLKSSGPLSRYLYSDPDTK